jgi:hypothetical protein
MSRILAIATQIGGPIREEAERLNADLVKYLERPDDPSRVAMMKEHALRLEQETREI